MSDRLHEIMGQIGILHNQLLENKKIKNETNATKKIETGVLIKK